MKDSNNGIMSGIFFLFFSHSERLIFFKKKKSLKAAQKGREWTKWENERLTVQCYVYAKVHDICYGDLFS